MEMFIVFLIGAVVGAGLTLLHIFLNFKVRDREWWEEHEKEVAGLRSGLQKEVAENARLRVSHAAGEMSEDANKVATMTMAALDADIATATEAV
jgi:hypothetical protein